MEINKKKRILVLNYEFPPLGGGAGNATFYLLKEFAKYNDLDIDLITSSVDKFRIEKFSNNINIHYLDINKKGNLHYQSIKDLLKYSFKAYQYSKKLKKEKKYNLIHAFFGIPCGYIAMKLGIPYIVSLRGADVPFHKKRFYWLDKLIFKNLSKKIWRKAMVVIANSRGLKEAAWKTSIKQDIKVICNGIDTDKFKPCLDKKIGKIIKLISVGRLATEKGYNYLLESLIGINNVSLTLVGSGPLERELKELSNKLDIKVDFVGRIDREEVIRKLQDSDIYISSSIKEGMSNSILEAMATGLPIITTDTGGSKELVKDNGFIIQKSDPNAIRDKLIKFIDNWNLVLSMGRESRELAKKMNWNKVANEYLNIYYENTSHN